TAVEGVERGQPPVLGVGRLDREQLDVTALGAEAGAQLHEGADGLARRRLAGADLAPVEDRRAAGPRRAGTADEGDDHRQGGEDGASAEEDGRAQVSPA